MTEIIFVKTRHVYDSYTDFWKLVELSGFESIYVDELDVAKEGVYIVSPMNGEWRPHIDNQADRPRNAHLILWNLERPAGSAGSIGNYAADNREMIAKRQLDEIWVSDRRLADETQFRFVVLGSDAGLGEIGLNKSHMFCHMSYETGRRQSIYKHFNKTIIGPNGWGDERHDTLLKSKFAVNVHQDPHPFQEPLRFALFAAYGLPIVSESIYDAYPWGDETMVFNDYDGLVGKLKQVFSNDYESWRRMGKRAHQMMCEEFQFGKMVKQAVDQSVNKWR